MIIKKHPSAWRRFRRSAVLLTVLLLFVGCGGEQQPSQRASTSQQADSLMELAFLAEDSGLCAADHIGDDVDGQIVR